MISPQLMVYILRDVPDMRKERTFPLSDNSRPFEQLFVSLCSFVSQFRGVNYNDVINCERQEDIGSTHVIDSSIAFSQLKYGVTHNIGWVF